MTTRTAPRAEVDLAALLGDGGEAVALGVQRVELGEDHVLAAAVDDQRAVAALAASAGLDRALARGRTSREDRAQPARRAPADGEPVGVEGRRRRHRAIS